MSGLATAPRGAPTASEDTEEVAGSGDGEPAGPRGDWPRAEAPQSTGELVLVMIGPGIGWPEGQRPRASSRQVVEPLDEQQPGPVNRRTRGQDLGTGMPDVARRHRHSRVRYAQFSARTEARTALIRDSEESKPSHLNC